MIAYSEYFKSWIREEKKIGKRNCILNTRRKYEKSKYN